MAHSSPLARHIALACPDDGITKTSIPELTLYRVGQPMPSSPFMYRPTICLIGQGKKKVRFGEETCSYNTSHFLISSVTMPVESEIYDISEESPYLGLSLEIDSYQISQLLIEMEQQDTPVIQKNEQIIQAVPTTKRLSDCFLRLLECLNSEMDQKILAPSIRREIYYEVLSGPGGYLLRNCVSSHSGANRIATVVNYIEHNYREDLDVERISRYASMSSSTLHEHFKKMTGMAPMQFVKSLRLHQAHSLLLGGKQAAEAAHQVGYNSPSQFSREFKRFFGIRPKEVQLYS